MKKLNVNDLSVKQKIGMTMVGCLTRFTVASNAFDSDLEYLLGLIREHALGAVWIDLNLEERKKAIDAINNTADYPILIISTAENGLKEFKIGMQNAIGVANREDLAYTFGKVIGIKARSLGCNVLNNPVLESQRGPGVCGMNPRTLGSDKIKVTNLAIQISKGIRDAGVLVFAKHYPSADNTYNIDSHMAEAYSDDDLDTVLNVDLYPYLELMKHNLLDGIMTEHFRLAVVDDEYPASLSKKTIDLIRDRGFDGVAITDAMCMMGIVAKYGKAKSRGMAVEAGNDLMLPYDDNEESFNALCQCYEEGIISDERLNEAARRVIEAQNKTLEQPKFDKITDEDIELFKKINTDSVYEYKDNGVSSELSKDGKHFFAVQIHTNTDITDDGKVAVDTFKSGWHFPEKITAKLNELFPNSMVRLISEYPSASQMQRTLEDSVDYDDVVFITYTEAGAYLGRECLTPRIVSLIEAMQVTNKISTLIHFGNPYVLEELAHISRVIIGCLNEDNVNTALDVLAGNYPAKGVPTYDINLK